MTDEGVFQLELESDISSCFQQLVMDLLGGCKYKINSYHVVTLYKTQYIQNLQHDTLPMLVQRLIAIWMTGTDTRHMACYCLGIDI